MIYLRKFYKDEDINNLCPHSRNLCSFKTTNGDYAKGAHCAGCEYFITFERNRRSSDWHILSVTLFFNTPRELDINVDFDSVFVEGEEFTKIPINIDEIDPENYKDKFEKLRLLL